MEVSDEMLHGSEITFVHPLRCLSSAVGASPPTWRRKKTRVETFEREESRVKLKTEDATVYISLAFQEKGEGIGTRKQ